MRGKGVTAVQDLPGKHGKPLDDPKAAIQELGGERDLTVRVTAPEGGEPHVFDTPGGELPSWDVGEQEATRKANGLALQALGNMHRPLSAGRRRPDLDGAADPRRSGRPPTTG